MNNPLVQMMSMMRQGQNPMQLLQQMALQDPRAAQALQMIQGKSPDQLRKMAENMARERGTTLEAVCQSMGIPMPK